MAGNGDHHDLQALASKNARRLGEKLRGYQNDLGRSRQAASEGATLLGDAFAAADHLTRLLDGAATDSERNDSDSTGSSNNT